jgi:hypothetical protein
MRASHILNRSAIPYHSADPIWGPSILNFSNWDCSGVSDGPEGRKAGSIAYEGFERDGDPTVIERKLVDGSLKQAASDCSRGGAVTRR